MKKIIALTIAVLTLTSCHVIAPDKDMVNPIKTIAIVDQKGYVEYEVTGVCNYMTNVITRTIYIKCLTPNDIFEKKIRIPKDFWFSVVENGLDNKMQFEISEKFGE